MTTGQGNRFVLASTQELHEKIQELANRVRQLEDGLRLSHAKASSETHPLLSEDLLAIKAPLQRDPAPCRQVKEVGLDMQADADPIDAVGSLSIVGGREKYYGHTANSWLFLQNECHEEDGDRWFDKLRDHLPFIVLDQATRLPVSPLHPERQTVDLQTLCLYLPSAARTLELGSIYFRYAAWMYNPISTESFHNQIYATFYDHNRALEPVPEQLLYHRLSVLFLVLAIGCLMDTSLPAYNLEAEKYRWLARAALFHSHFFEEPTMLVVQSLLLMSFYLFLADRHGSRNGIRWAIMGIATKLAQSIGLHRDSGRWNIDSEEIKARRVLFWELFTYDLWQCHTFGRPPSFSLAHINCKMPFANDSSDEQAFHAWKHRFTSECMNVLHDQAFGARLPTYATVLQLDRKMRAFPVPPILQVAGFGSSEIRLGALPETAMLTLQRHVVLAIRETNLLYLHRGFFAKAISDHAKDPLSSPYGTSVIAAYRSAGSLVALMRNLHSQMGELSERLWFLWTHMFSCTIVLGSIVTRCPSMSLAPSALQQLNSACDLFSSTAHRFRAGKVLDIMLRLQEKAQFSLKEYREGRGCPLNKSTMSPSSVSENSLEADDELSVLGGKTRLVKGEPSSTPPMEQSPNTFNPIVPLPLTPGMQGDMHPNVREYLHSFPNSKLPHSSSTVMDKTLLYGNGPPLSTQGMTTGSDLPQFLPESMSFLPSPPMQSAQTPHQPQWTQQQPTMMNNMGPNQLGLNPFPQYFPVYDYSVMNGHGGPSSSPIMEHAATPPQSGSPEGNMQTAWSDFMVANGYV